MGVTMEDAEVEGEEGKDEGDEAGVGPQLHIARLDGRVGEGGEGGRKEGEGG
jgi:hypothetical protein